MINRRHKETADLASNAHNLSFLYILLFRTTYAKNHYWQDHELEILESVLYYGRLEIRNAVPLISFILFVPFLVMHGVIRPRRMPVKAMPGARPSNKIYLTSAKYEF